MSLRSQRAVPKDDREWIQWLSQQTPQEYEIVVVTTTTHTIEDEDIVIVDDDTAAGAVAITVPTAVNNEGRWVHIKKIGSTGSVTCTAPETIDNSANQIISVQYDNMKIVSDGLEWWII